MDVNFLDLLYRALGPDFASLVSKYLGEPEKPTQTSIDNLLPVLLVRPYVHNDHYWQVYYDTNRMIRNSFGEGGLPFPG